jgi:Arc/MetJ-type ribon-helix-helix transcriptional regulator
MATKKITVTLEEQQVENIRRLVASGKAPNVSGFVKHAVDVALADAVGWGAMLARALEETGGPLSAKERAWADAVLGTRSTKGRKKRSAA